MKNNSLVEIGNELIKADSVLIFPHILLDGDTFGSSVALCQVLRDMGKECYVLVEDKIPDFIKFLEEDYCTYEKDKIKNPDICVCVDCITVDRFIKRAETFEKGKIKIGIDHHKTSEHIWDFNYIDSEAAATAEVIFDLINAMKVPITKGVAEGIYLGILTDTGSFQYSNTTGRTHEIVAKLYDTDMDQQKISLAVYENERLEKLKLHSLAFKNLELFSDNQIAIVYITQKMLKECNADMEDTEGLVTKIRSIAGVEIGILLKEINENTIKVTLRAKTRCDVSKIALNHGGGGHTKAAGCTIYDSMEKVKEIIVEEGKELL